MCPPQCRGTYILCLTSVPQILTGQVSPCGLLLCLVSLLLPAPKLRLPFLSFWAHMDWSSEMGAMLWRTFAPLLCGSGCSWGQGQDRPVAREGCASTSLTILASEVPFLPHFWLCTWGYMEMPGKATWGGACGQPGVCDICELFWLKES